MAAENVTHTEGWYPLQDQFSSVHYHSHVIIGSFMVMILLLAVVGNTIVIVVFLWTRKLRTPSNSLIVNLAIADLLMALTGFPLLIVSSFSGHWVYDDWVCDFYGTTATMFGLMSINTLVFISLDRYVVIVSPQHIHKVTYVHARFCIFAIWVYSLTWAIMPIFGWNRYIREGYGTTCTIDYFTREEPHNHFLLCMLLADYVMPCSLIVYCYIWIFHTVKSHSLAFFPILSDTKSQSGKSSGKGAGSRSSTRSSLRMYAPHGQTKEKHRRMKWTETEYKIARTVFVVILFYCMAWTPYAVVTLVGQYGDVKRITPTVSMLPAVFAKVSTVYNPIVYSLTHPRFKIQLRKMLNVVLPEASRRGHLSRDASSRLSGRAMHNRTMDTSESHSPSNGSFTDSPRRVPQHDILCPSEGIFKVKMTQLSKHKEEETSEPEIDVIDESAPCLEQQDESGINDEFLTPIQELPEQDSPFSTEELHLMKSAMSGKKTLCRAVFLRHPERSTDNDRFKDDNITKANWRDISGESLISVNIEAIKMERIT